MILIYTQQSVVYLYLAQGLNAFGQRVIRWDVAVQL